MRLNFMAYFAVVLLISGCASNQAKLEAAAKDKAKAEASVRIVQIAKKLPPQPAECGKKEASGAALGDRLDIAWKKAENALSRSNARGARCAGWYQNLRAGFAK